MSLDRSLIATVIAVACGCALILCALADWRWSGDVRLGITGAGIAAAGLR